MVPVGQYAPRALHDLVRTRRDRDHCLLNHWHREARPSQLPQQIVRVAGNAVAAGPWPGGKGHKTIRFRRRSADYVHNVDVQHLTNIRELVGQRDIHSSKSVFHQFRHLGCVRAGNHVDPLGACAQQLRCSVPARRGDPTDDPGNILMSESLDSGIDSFRRKRHMAVHSGDPLAAGQRHGQQIPRRPNVGRGRQDYQLASHRVLHNRCARTTQYPQVRHLVRIDWRRHADQDRCRPGKH